MSHTTHSFLALTLGLVFTGCGPADSAPATGEDVSAEASAQIPFIPAGSALTFAVDQEISTKSTTAGDAFSAHLVSELLSEAGEVLLPAGSVLTGAVTESVESPTNDQPAVIRLAVESVETPAGIANVIAEVEEVEMESDAKDTNQFSAGKVVVGAVAGAIVGEFAGRTKTGAAVGTAAGAAVAIATRDGHATIPAGAKMVVRLKERLAVR